MSDQLSNNSAEQQTDSSPEVKRGGLWRMVDGVRSTVGKAFYPVQWVADKALDGPIRHKAGKDMETVDRMALTSGQKADIAESKEVKYVGTTRDSMRRALLGASGLVVLGPVGAFFAVLNVISTVTGLAWYTITLKDVQKAHIELGIEMTGYVLRSFLTSLFALGIAGSAYAAGQTPHFQMVLDWMRDAGYDPETLYNSAEFQTIAIALGVRMEWQIISDLHTATVQFDAVDTLQAGAGPTALRFFENSISNLQKAVDLLRDEHSPEAANAAIAVAIGSVHDFLTTVEADIGEEIHRAAERLIGQIDMSVEEFDKIVYPLLDAIMQAYAALTEEEGAGPIKNVHKRATAALKSVNQKREARAEISQGLSDQVIAIVLDCIKDCMNAYQDRIGNLAETLQLAQDDNEGDES